MNEASTSTVRPVPRWLHWWAILTAMWAFAVLVLGALVTTFQVGMSDPIWPTQPWFLLQNGWKEPRAGFLIEHSHRFAAFGIGGLVVILSLALWARDPRKGTRRAGLAILVVLVAVFGLLHTTMRTHFALGEMLLDMQEMQTQARLAESPPELPRARIVALEQIRAQAAADPSVPLATVVETVLKESLRRTEKNAEICEGILVVAFGIIGLMGITSIAAGVPGSGLRLLGVFALGGVMVQGLLGGFRVKLNAKYGVDLAAIHGIMGQVMFSLLVALAVLTGRPRTWDTEEEAVRGRLHRLATILVLVVFCQLVWGAMIRHAPTPLMQRLHLLTAFVVVGVAVSLLMVGFRTINGRSVLGFGSVVLGLLLSVQVTLGEEAWIGKFTQYILPEMVPVTPEVAMIRTLHALIGSGVLATSVVLAIRTGRGRLLMNDAEAKAWAEKTGRMPQQVLVGSPQQGETS